MNGSNFSNPRLLTEGFAIVVSILVAFAIDAAWDERLERQQLRDVLTTLASDLEESLPLVESNGQRIIADLERLRILIGAEEDSSPAFTQSFLDGILEAMIRPTGPEPARGCGAAAGGGAPGRRGNLTSASSMS